MSTLQQLIEQAKAPVIAGSTVHATASSDTLTVVAQVPDRLVSKARKHIRIDVYNKATGKRIPKDQWQAML